VRLFYVFANIVGAAGGMIRSGGDLLSFVKAVSSDDTVLLLMVFIYEILPPVVSG
jgi:hypothetical protein